MIGEALAQGGELSGQRRAVAENARHEVDAAAELVVALAGPGIDREGGLTQRGLQVLLRGLGLAHPAAARLVGRGQRLRIKAALADEIAVLANESGQLLQGYCHINRFRFHKMFPVRLKPGVWKISTGLAIRQMAERTVAWRSGGEEGCCRDLPGGRGGGWKSPRFRQRKNWSCLRRIKNPAYQRAVEGIVPKGGCLGAKLQPFCHRQLPQETGPLV